MRDERRKEAIDRRKTERQKVADLASYLADSVVESANGRSSGHGLTISSKRGTADAAEKLRFSISMYPV